MRPAVSRTRGRSARPDGETPRITTFDGLPVEVFTSEISTTASFDTSGRPSAPSATDGCISSALACWWSIALWISVSAPLRITTTLSGSPVETSVCVSPASSISTVANTKITSAIPPAVSAVVRRRAHRLRAT
ncbi:hypothetical protein FEQ01_06484 [Burkholderia pseudomultivorans]|nr:hypothetical protein [Burkholderia pseudomultivorans]